MLDLARPDFLPPALFPCIAMAQTHLELWHYYYGLGPLYLNPAHGYGEGPAPGIGNIHSGVAADTEQYFADVYPEEDWLPVASSHGRRLELLHRYKWNVRYVAAYLRQLADVRTGVTGSHTDLTMTDMKMIFTAYHADLQFCFVRPDENRNATEAFQERDHPEAFCEIYGSQLEPFIDLYRRR